ncbi:MAG TPA: LysR family transcriptional regulator [Candidatus Limnocylindrales bacterium]|nr:LysR family transcriptional regulator [Candidatus Limnocylindrales bacterium]
MLATFLTVAETGSFTRAGERLRVTQSAVSQQVRALEQDLGSTLFARQTRKVTLTQAGSVLLPYARQIVRKVEEARAVVSDFEGMGRGRVSVGSGGAVCHHILPDLVREFSSRFGKIDVQVLSGFSIETLQRTLDGTVDLGILLLPVQESGLVVTELGRDELVAIAPRDHAWTALERVKAKDFAGQPLVVYDRRSQTFRLLERFVLEAGVFPSIAMEISDLEAVKKMVAAGLGVSLVARWAVRKEELAGDLVVRPLGPRGLYRTWGLVRRANDVLTASQRSFVSICTSRFPDLLA